MKPNIHEWSRDSYFSKAQLYAEEMEKFEDADWQFGLWSSLLLENLVRASVAHISPALVADNHEWANILYALGAQPKKSKFVPKTAAITDVVTRAEEVCAEFTREHANFCINHFARRNGEVHSGSLAFSNISVSSWLPNFYAVCNVLLKFINESLDSLFGEEISLRALDDIEALQDETAKSIKGTIHAHQVIWESKAENDKEDARAQAAAANLRHYGHRTTCPACRSTALIHGKAAMPAKQSIVEDGIIERQVMKPESFSCVSCGLKFSGYSKMLAAGLGDSFTSTSHYDAVEYFQVDIDRHIRNLMDDDNNEY